LQATSDWLVKESEPLSEIDNVISSLSDLHRPRELG